MTTHRLICGDLCKTLETLRKQAVPTAAMAFADPPDNVGLKYDSYVDNIDEGLYVAFLTDVFIGLTCRADINWMSFNPKWTLPLAASIVNRGIDGWEFKPCVQTFTFGQHNRRDLGVGHRPLWRLRHKSAPLYPNAVKVESWRQQHGDKRAAPGGRVPCDVFDFPRVTGNSKQRRPWHPTQLHEGLVERCVLLSTKPGDTVIDAFSGTGTTLRVCKRLGRNTISIEMDPGYCQKIAEEHGLTVENL